MVADVLELSQVLLPSEELHLISIYKMHDAIISPMKTKEFYTVFDLFVVALRPGNI